MLNIFSIFEGVNYRKEFTHVHALGSLLHPVSIFWIPMQVVYTYRSMSSCSNASFVNLNRPLLSGILSIGASVNFCFRKVKLVSCSASQEN